LSFDAGNGAQGVAEIAAGVTSLRASFDLAKAMLELRDQEAFRTKSIELQGLIVDALEKAIAAREAQASQADIIRALEAEVADLKAWGAQEQKYELKNIGGGSVALMLKPEARGASPPHWLCPTCFAQRKKAFFQGTGTQIGRGWVYQCQGCGHKVTADFRAQWTDAPGP
jgi:hypothetical protein